MEQITPNAPAQFTELLEPHITANHGQGLERIDPGPTSYPNVPFTIGGVTLDGIDPRTLGPLFYDVNAAMYSGMMHQVAPLAPGREHLMPPPLLTAGMGLGGGMSPPGPHMSLGHQMQPPALPSFVPSQGKSLFQDPTATRSYLNQPPDTLIDSKPNSRFVLPSTPSTRGRKAQKATGQGQRRARSEVSGQGIVKSRPQAAATGSMSTRSARSASQASSSGGGPSGWQRHVSSQSEGGLTSEWPAPIKISAPDWQLPAPKVDPVRQHFRLACPRMSAVLDRTVLGVLSFLNSRDLYALSRSESDREATLEREFVAVRAPMTDEEVAGLEQAYIAMDGTPVYLTTMQLPIFLQNLILLDIEAFYDAVLEFTDRLLFSGLFNLRRSMSPEEIKRNVAEMKENEQYLSKLGPIPKDGTKAQPQMLQGSGFKTFLRCVFYSGPYSMAGRKDWKDEAPLNAMAAINTFFNIVLTQYEETGERDLRETFSPILDVGLPKYGLSCGMVFSLQRYSISGPKFVGYRKSLPVEFQRIVRPEVSNMYLCEGDVLVE